MEDASLPIDAEFAGTAKEASRRAGYGLEPIRASTTRRFVWWWVGGIFLGAILYVAVTLLWVNYRTDHDSEWIAFLYQQKKVAVERRSGPGPRILIVGGSGALFGIDAELIEKKFQIPTVNYGTHAGLGLRYELYRAAKELRPGDIVVLAAEYDTWNDTYFDEPGAGMKFIWTYDRNYFLHQNIAEQFKMFTCVSADDWGESLQGWRRRMNGVGLEVEDLTRFNVATMDLNGDLRHIVPGKAPYPTTYRWADEPDRKRKEAVLAFARFARSNGIRVFVTFPNHILPAPPLSDEQTDSPPWLNALIDQAGLVTLDSPRENSYPHDWFMDTRYHINPCGRRIRTEELIRRLRPQLGLPSTPLKSTGVYLVAGVEHRLTDGNLFLNDPGIVATEVRRLHADQR